MKKRMPKLRMLFLGALAATVLAVLAVTTFLFLKNYRQSLIQNARTTSRQTISQVSKTVNEYLGDIDDIWLTLETAMEDPELEREAFFDVFLNIRRDVVAVSTYDAGGDLVHCYTLDYAVRDDIEENLSFRPENVDAYEDGFVSAPHVVTLFEGEYPWVVTMIMPLSADGAEEWAALDIRCSNISAYINDIGIGQRGYCFLMDHDGNIIYHPQQQLIYSDLKREDIAFISALEDGVYEDGTEIYTVQTLDNGSWRAVGVTSVQDVITGSLESMTGILLLDAVIIIIATTVVSLLLVSVLSRPINNLAAARREFEQNTDTFVYEPVGGAYEVAELSGYFGHMVGKIKQLMNKVRSEEVNLRKTELRALQAQINPHFLYNTLDSICLMCELGKSKEAVMMINALARLFRISISKGHELIPIRSEVQHATSYLQIQSIRYKDQFSYVFDVEEGCMDYLCNKITLQPIIENALLHGINGLVDEGEIRITVRSDGDDIEMRVEDNGVGMDEDQIARILRKGPSDKSGIGIKNVNDRLRIFFGPEYGLRIESAPDEGTSVILRMPKVSEEAEYEKR